MQRRGLRKNIVCPTEVRSRVSWVRKVGAHGRIEFYGAKYSGSGKVGHHYKVAALSTYHRLILFKHTGLRCLTVYDNKKQFAMLIWLPVRDKRNNG